MVLNTNQSTLTELEVLQSIFSTFDLTICQVPMDDGHYFVCKNNARVFSIKLTPNKNNKISLRFYITRNNINYYKTKGILDFISVYKACKLFLDNDIQIIEQSGEIQKALNLC